mmetsp:Transcript_20194/g.51703  ORF Transcript_20194/g.51703 Transcript_20194/m.51703 type:complete len:233 (-) Transcript_20194:75-773(-)
MARARSYMPFASCKSPCECWMHAARLMSREATSTWLGPSAFSRMASARLYRPCASEYRPPAFTMLATCSREEAMFGCCAGSSSSRSVSARRNMASAPCTSPFAFSTCPRVLASFCAVSFRFLLGSLFRFLLAGSSARSRPRRRCGSAFGPLSPVAWKWLPISSSAAGSTIVRSGPSGSASTACSARMSTSVASSRSPVAISTSAKLAAPATRSAGSSPDALSARRYAAVASP